MYIIREENFYKLTYHSFFDVSSYTIDKIERSLFLYNNERWKSFVHKSGVIHIRRKWKRKPIFGSFNKILKCRQHVTFYQK